MSIYAGCGLHWAWKRGSSSEMHLYDPDTLSPYTILRERYKCCYSPPMYFVFMTFIHFINCFEAIKYRPYCVLHTLMAGLSVCVLLKRTRKAFFLTICYKPVNSRHYLTSSLTFFFNRRSLEKASLKSQECHVKKCVNKGSFSRWAISRLVAGRMKNTSLFVKHID